MGRIRRTKRPAGSIERKLAWVRRVLWWEAVWPWAWPTAALLAAFAALALLGFIPLTPAWLHDGVLVLFALLVVSALLRVRRVARPSADVVRRRLEDDSRLPHRPLKTLTDIQALGAGDPLSRVLWEAERTRLTALTRHLSVGWPRRLPSGRDPLGLRFVATVLLVVALGGAGGEAGPRLARALTPALPAWGGPSATVEAWITPPAYTHMAPIHLNGAPPREPLDVPQGSALLVEVQGGRSVARLAIGRTPRDFARLGPASQRADATLTTSERVAVRQGWRTLAQWHIAVVADQPPSVAFWGAPEGDRDGRLRLPVEAHDDYGVTRAWAVIRRPDTSESFDVDLPLDQTRPADIRQEVRLDLTGHPWAGLPVTIALGAADEVGHQVRSAAMAVTLPMRDFTHPVARAIAEMRRTLLSTPGRRRDVAVAVRALAANPDVFGGDFSVLLALTVAGAHLIDDPSSAATAEAADLLWQAAVKVEDGDRPEARQALERAIAEMRRGLAEGAPGADIERLTAQLQQALRRYLEALAQQAARQGTSVIPPDARVVSPDDLTAMVERLHDLAATGSKEAAERMLSELGALLNGVESGLHAPGSDQARAAMKTLDELSGIARDQQGLLDETFRRNQTSNPPALTPPALGLLSPRAPNGRTAPNRRAGPGDRATAQRQDALRHRLGRLMESLDAQGIDVPMALGQAEEAMGDATRALGRGAMEDAEDAQNEAVERLNQGTREANRSVAERMGGGLSGAGATGRDPLGRPGGGSMDGDDVTIPKQSEVKKAREVLDELRRRASEGTRPPAEHDYLQRLLRSLF